MDQCQLLTCNVWPVQEVVPICISLSRLLWIFMQQNVGSENQKKTCLQWKWENNVDIDPKDHSSRLYCEWRCHYYLHISVDSFFFFSTAKIQGLQQVHPTAQLHRRPLQ